VFRVARPRREHKIPAVMSREEVRQLLGCFRTSLLRVFFTTVYACGLRVSEGVQLQVGDVDGQRLLLHVHGKATGSLRAIACARPPNAATFLETHHSVPGCCHRPAPNPNSPHQPRTPFRVSFEEHATV